jgi:hypothetical protein
LPLFFGDTWIRGITEEKYNDDKAIGRNKQFFMRRKIHEQGYTYRDCTMQLTMCEFFLGIATEVKKVFGQSVLPF